MLKTNPGLKPGGLDAPKRHQVLSEAQIERLLDAATPRIRLAIMLLLYTAQRPGDVLAMTWPQVQRHGGRLWLTLRQQKTGELIRVPAHARLAAELETVASDAGVSLDPMQVVAPGAAAKQLLVVPSPRGLPWRYRNFARAWDKARKSADWALARQWLRAGIAKDEIREELLKGYQRRDFRRTSMVRMAEAGATAIQIAGVSGHSINATTRILDTYIPRRGDVAAKAIGAWEAAPASSVLAFPTPSKKTRRILQNR